MARAIKSVEIHPLSVMRETIAQIIADTNKVWRGTVVLNKTEQKAVNEAKALYASSCYSQMKKPVLALTRWMIIEVESVKYVIRRGGDKPYWRCGFACIAFTAGTDYEEGYSLTIHAAKGMIVDPQQPSVEEMLCHSSEAIRTIGKEMSDGKI
jgi:hypothetical protein